MGYAPRCQIRCNRYPLLSLTRGSTCTPLTAPRSAIRDVHVIEFALNMGPGPGAGSPWGVRVDN
eukprot:4439978-Prymnesium_polylepis.1